MEKFPPAQLDDHARRVLRSEFASGIMDFPTKKSVVDVEGGFDIARRIAEQSSVLLKNDKGCCPSIKPKCAPSPSSERTPMRA